MSNLNQCIFTGHLGDDITLRYMPDGKAVANVGLAVNQRHKNKNKETVDYTTWVSLTLIGKTAEILASNAGKGSFLRVTTEYRVRKYDKKDKEGTGYSHEFMVSEFEFLDYSDVKKRKASQPVSNANRDAKKMAGNDDLGDNDIPF